MKYLAYLYKIIAISLSLFILIPSVVYADSSVDVSGNGDGSTSDVNINSQSNGQSTVCHNGNCTTTGGGSSTTYCYNGQCTSTHDGNVNYTSPDGHTHINVNNNTGNTSVAPSPQPTAGAADVSQSPTDKLVPSLTPDPTIAQMRNDINKHVKQEIEA